jgi:hypothetical protein
MKKILLLFVVAGMIFIGCFDSGTNNNTNPVAATQSNSVTSTQPNPETSAQSNLMPLYGNFSKPNKNPKVDDFHFTIDKNIDGNIGGRILLNRSNRKIHVFALLNIPRNAFQGSVNISIYVDPSTASIKFSPQMTFKYPLILNAYILGLDLKSMNLDSKDVGFYYFPTKGPRVNVRNQGVSSDLILRKLSVSNAVINHFSRYGWSK